MGKQVIPLWQSGRALAAAAALCSLVAAGCGGGSNEVISNRKIMGQVSVLADNSTPGGPKTVKGATKPVPASETVTKDPSTAYGRVGDWNTITVRGFADQGKPPPGVPPAPARIEFTSTAVESSEFTLRQNGRVVDMKVDLHWIATLKKGKATITVNAAIAGPSSCTLSGTFELVTDLADATDQTIDVTGYRPFKMKNGGGSDDKGMITGPQCTLNAGDYTLTWSVALAAMGDRIAEVNVDRAILSLHR